MSKKRELNEAEKIHIVKQLRILNKLPEEERVAKAEADERLYLALIALDLEEESNPRRKKNNKKYEEFIQWYNERKAQAELVKASDDKADLGVLILEEGNVEELTNHLQSLINDFLKSESITLQKYIKVLEQYSIWKKVTETQLREKGNTKSEAIVFISEVCNRKFGYSYVSLQQGYSNVYKLCKQYPKLLLCGANRSTIKTYASNFKKHMSDFPHEVAFWSMNPKLTHPVEVGGEEEEEELRFLVTERVKHIFGEEQIAEIISIMKNLKEQYPEKKIDFTYTGEVFDKLNQMTREERQPKPGVPHPADKIFGNPNSVTFYYKCNLDYLETFEVEE